MLRVQAGDREAYRALLEDVCGELRALLQRRLSGALEVDDVLQDVLLTLHRARHTNDTGRPFDPWLNAIPRNAAVDAFRRARGRLRWERLAGDDAPLEESSDDAGRETSLARVLARLPKAQRSAIEMVKLQGMSVAEAARRAGIAPGAMRVRVHRGYRALRALLVGEEMTRLRADRRIPSRPTPDLILQLTERLRPVRRLWPPPVRLTLFGLLQVLVLFAAGLALGLRADLPQKLDESGFRFEIAFIIAFAVTSTVLAIHAAVPGRELRRRTGIRTVVLAVVGLATAFATTAPLDPATRHFVAMGWPCTVRTTLVASVPWVALGFAVRRGAALAPGLAGIFIGAASFLFAAASLRISCPLDSAAHLLVWHLGPVLVGIFASMLIGAICLSVRRRIRHGVWR